MRDRVMYPEPDQVEVAIPYALFCHIGGGTRNADGTYTYAPPPLELQPLELCLDEWGLGRWVIDAVSATHSGSGHTSYVATLRRVGDLPRGNAKPHLFQPGDVATAICQAPDPHGLTDRCYQLPGDPIHRVEPVDDAVAHWLKARRDSFESDSGDPEQRTAWLALNEALDDYRDHRVTGTPVDQPLSED